MTVNLAIIGLGQVGISTALALKAKETDIRCHGWDIDPERRTAANDSDAFQKTHRKVKDAVADADLVILNVAPDELREVLEEIKGNLAANTILVNMSRLHALPAQIVDEVLAKNKRFVSLLPVVNPELMQESLEKTKDGCADLFEHSLAYISAPPSTEAQVLDTAVDLAVLLGSLPVFADAHEVDGLAAANLTLPEMAACVLMDTLSRQPSWRDGGTIAGSELAQASAPLDKLDISTSVQTMRANRENNMRLLDDLITDLQRFKAALQEDEGKKLEEILGVAVKAREVWIKNRSQASVPAAATSSIPTEKYALERFLDLGR